MHVLSLLWFSHAFWPENYGLLQLAGLFITGNPKIIRSHDELSSSGDQSKANWEIQVLRVCEKRKNKDSRNLNCCKHFIISQICFVLFCLNSKLHWSHFLLSLANSIHRPFSILRWILPHLFFLHRVPGLNGYSWLLDVVHP